MKRPLPVWVVIGFQLVLLSLQPVFAHIPESQPSTASSHEGETAVWVRECEQDASAEPDQKNWKVAEKSALLVSDLNTIAGCSIFIASQILSEPVLFSISAGMAATSQTVEFFRDLRERLTACATRPSDPDSIAILVDTTGQVISVAGMCLLAGEFHPAITGWLSVAGGLIKFINSGIELARKGMEGTFGNNQNLRNGFFRIGCLGVGNVIGGLCLASGFNTEIPELISTGIYIIGFANGIGILDVLASDVESLYTLIHSRSAQINPNSLQKESEESHTTAPEPLSSDPT
jgi:hypothetical protein